MSGVTLKNVIKRYGDVQVIHGVDLAIEDGEFCVFVGPSGCGKSTLMRMVAGLEETTEGQIHIGSRDVTRVDPAERGVAMVFQTYALYPHMTVEENMGFGLKMNGVSKEEIKNKTDEASRILKLNDYLDRKPAALSGGQQSRAALARLLVQANPIILLDEPFAALGPALKAEMLGLLAQVQSELQATILMVTHDPKDAQGFSTKTVVVADGVASPPRDTQDLFADPTEALRAYLGTS